MKANKAPEKLYVELCSDGVYAHDREWENSDNIEYTRTDAFIEKALKWYCLDCACNDNCAANHKCVFWSFFKGYLEGNDKALPPKISNAFNPDGSTTENYLYRHLIERIQDDFIEKAVNWLYEHANDYIINDRYPLPSGEMSRDWLKVKSDMFSDFKAYMKGE